MGVAWATARNRRRLDMVLPAEEHEPNDNPPPIARISSLSLWFWLSTPNGYTHHRSS